MRDALESAPGSATVLTDPQRVRGGVVEGRAQASSVVSPPAYAPRAADPVSASSRASRRFRLWSFVLLVVVPTVCAAAFTLAVASARYTSEFRVAVRSASQPRVGGLSDLFGASSFSQSANDANAIVQYLHSRNALEEAGAGSADARAYFTMPTIDWISRLDPAAPVERVARYWNAMVDSYFEPQTGTVVVKVTAFSREAALQLASKLLANAEALTNRMSERARGDTVRFSRQEAAEAEARLAAVRERVRALQDREGILAPQKAAEANLDITAKLKDEIAHRYAELYAARANLSANAPTVTAAREKIAGLERELAGIQSEATSSEAAARPLSAKMIEFQKLLDEQTFAEKAYEGSLASLEAAKMEAAKQEIYLATIVRPGLPEEASFPRPARDIGVTLTCSFLSWLIFVMSAYAIREHM